jgi:hypothetical protein
MSKVVLVTAAIIVVLTVLVVVRKARAQNLPTFRTEDATDEAAVAKFVEAFLKSDTQARQLLNRSNLALFKEGYRPRLGTPHDPESAGEKYNDLRSYFARKLYLDLHALKPFRQATFQKFVDEIDRSSDETIMCTGDLAEKHHLNISGGLCSRTKS